MKAAKVIWFLLGAVFTLYLLLPAPSLPPPGLNQSLKSTEPGDVNEIENLSAYFTELERDEVINFYKDYFSKSSFLNIPLLTVKINHPPEYAKEIIRDTIQTYYLEELVHPFRESLFINGFDWEKDVFTPQPAREQNKMIAGGQEWRVKVTLKWFNSSPLVRIVIFWAAWFLTKSIAILLVKLVKKI